MSDTVYAVSHSCFCPLGTDSQKVFESVIQKENAFQQLMIKDLLPESQYRNDSEKITISKLNVGQNYLLNECFSCATYSKFEQMCLFVARQAIDKSQIDPSSKDCLFILSSTKGNINFLDNSKTDLLNLSYSAQLISKYFKNPNQAIIISNACISGALALQTGKRLLEIGKYRQAIIIGCDILSDFVLSGFQSFHALSSLPCRPFDKKRDGLNLGEAAAAMILSVNQDSGNPLAILSGGATSNDANHISGPSRTGEELAFAISKAMKESGVDSNAIDFISAHGTATNYNDEMEAKAFNLAGVNQSPIHSLKSFIGHTLGASGIIESIIACMGMERQIVLPTLNFESSGVSVPIHLYKEAKNHKINFLLKTASGFGGCNAALIWQRAN